MTEDKKVGITHAIRKHLGFEDTRLWKRFLARRLELIDTLELSSKKASEQEDEIKKVAQILLQEFNYGPEYFADFDKLVRAAVQSVRRNRKRSTKTGRANVKRRPGLDNKLELVNKPSFIAEIANLNTDDHDEVYDMTYLTAREITEQDMSRAAIDSIIKPTDPSLNKTRAPSGQPLSVLLPPLLRLPSNHSDIGGKLQSARSQLLALIKRSKLCLMLSLLTQNELYRVIGQAAITLVSALVLQKSFPALNPTSAEHLRERIGQTEFQARFYRSLEPASPMTSALDNSTATSTLHTLIGCCIKDFGFDSVLTVVGEAFYRSLLLEFPLALRSLVPFTSEEKIEPDSAPNTHFPTSLSSLATVAAELRSQNISTNSHLSDTASVKVEPDTFIRAEADAKKNVTLKFLESKLTFAFPTANLAPPCFTEIINNARQAFRLNEFLAFGLKNSRTGAILQTDFDLEALFNQNHDIELEIFSQSRRAIPIHEIASTIVPTEDRLKIVLPPPIPQISPVSRESSPRELSTRPLVRPLLPKFQPLL